MKKLLKNPLFYLSIILIVALVLRLLEINKTSFWYDEAFTGNTIQMPWKEMFDVIARDKVHPPLFYIMTKVCGFVFGYSQTALRSFSVLWGMLTVALGYFIGKELFDKKEKDETTKDGLKKFPLSGLILSTILAISPFFVTYSIEARSYAFLAFLALLLSYTVLRYINSSSKKEKTTYLTISIFVGLTLCFTHYLQAVYIVGIIVACLAYKYAYTEKGLNLKLIKTFCLIAAVGLITIALLPIQEFLSSKGIAGSWWVPNVRIDDIVRVYYSYLLGVSRYVNGVPPQRELMIPISQFVLATLFFILHFIGLVIVIKDNSIDIQVKRNTFFLYVLSLITFVGFMSLSLFNVNIFVERYTIAPGVVLILSIASILSLVLGSYKKTLLVMLLSYILLISLLKPMPFIIDYRNVAATLTSISKPLDVSPRYIYSSPTDMINSEYYTGSSNAYFLFYKPNEYSGWALVDDSKGIRLEDIRTTDLFIITLDQLNQYTSFGFKEIARMENSLVIMRKGPPIQIIIN